MELDARSRVALAALLVGAIVAGAVALSPRAKESPAPATTTDASSTAPSDAGSTISDASAIPSASTALQREPAPYVELDGGTLEERNEVLLVNMERELGLSPIELQKIGEVFAASEYVGQGNPKVSRRAMSRAECLARRKSAPRLAPADPRCGRPNMVSLYDPSAGETSDKARTCIDQFEFPNMACEYPLVWVRANEAQTLCRALGKRLCDAHEWEGACAGALKSPEREYPFDTRRIMMQYLHNKGREIVWAYGKEKNHAVCASGSQKSPRCLAGGYTVCGTNDYPAGSFPKCVSPLGVYDLHGNVAEHMSLPRKLEELGSRGGSGETEMKGSWFIFSQAEAHEDDCRFRAPDWHVTKVDDPNSHRNYHLGFRCCKDLPAPAR
jgi:hypothetical protein